MNNEYIQKLFAQRLGGENFGDESVLYKFEKIKRALQPVYSPLR